MLYADKWMTDMNFPLPQQLGGTVSRLCGGVGEIVSSIPCHVISKDVWRWYQWTPLTWQQRDNSGFFYNTILTMNSIRNEMSLADYTKKKHPTITKNELPYFSNTKFCSGYYQTKSIFTRSDQGHWHILQSLH